MRLKSDRMDGRSFVNSIVCVDSLLRVASMCPVVREFDDIFTEAK